MRNSLVFACSAVASLVNAAVLNDVCTAAYVKATLPLNVMQGLTLNASTLVATAITNRTVLSSNDVPNGQFDYCSVTFAYSHDGRSDQVQVTYWLPTPANFRNRYLSTGGGGWAINSGANTLPSGLIYGAVAGETDGGFGGFASNYLNVVLLANGSLNYPELYMFGYQAHHELSTIGKQFTKNFFSMRNGTKLYSYYQGCSEGGREGWSQVQRYGDSFDGAIIGAPAFRYSFQQVQHLWSNVVEKTLGYYPPPCELDYINNATVAACDGLDGKVDGVVSRTDLCKLHFNISSVLGHAYSCPASKGQIFPPSGPAPAQNGSVTTKGIQVARLILDGPQDLQGLRVYFSYQPSATFADAVTNYNSTSGGWDLAISGLGGAYVTNLLQLVELSNLPTLEGVSYDTLRDWIYQGWQKYNDVLQTNWPDLTPFHNAGGKVLHYHGESDNSIPAASSVRYWNSVRQIMYPNMTANASTAALNKWYRLFLVPGAGHCGPNTLQPNGPYPQTNMAVMVKWVEENVVPTTLNATVLQGPNKGQNEQICAWPLRPLWTNGTSSECSMRCVHDQASIDSWSYNLTAFKMPVY